MTGIVRAGAADLDVLSEVIAEAFFGLPPSRWLISDPGQRRRVFPAYFRLYLEHALAHGVIDTTPGRDAAALWLPVSSAPPPQLPGYQARLTAITGPWTEAFLAFDAALDQRHPAGIRHDHLAILAVHPSQQRRGAGTALLQAHHATLDQAGTPAYLEASSQRNRRLYLRHGYTDHDPPIRLPGGPFMHPMWRPPRRPKPGQ